MKERNKQITAWLDRFYMKVIILATCSFKKSMNELINQSNMISHIIDPWVCVTFRSIDNSLFFVIIW